MAKTLLNGVNEVLKRAGIIQGDTGTLTTLSDSARQVHIDLAVQIWNEAMDELYDYSGEQRPNEQAEGTITLATGTRAYTLASDLNKIQWPLIDKTNNQYIWEYEWGYNGLLLLDPEQDNTGLPHWAAISPVDGTLHMDRAPTSVENGNIYTYQYDKDLVVSAAADTFPFKDVVFRAMVPAVKQLWDRDRKRSFDGDIFRRQIGVAASYLTQTHRETTYNPRR